MNEYNKAVNQGRRSEKSKKSVNNSDNVQKQAAFIKEAEAKGFSPEQAQQAAEKFFPVSGS
jgi:hypothetical protein